MYTNNQSITRVQNPSKKEFVELWKQCRPFLIDGVATNWNAYRNWFNSYLLSKCGNDIIRVKYSEPNLLNNYNYVFHKFGL
ncbi:MAG: hypothetical protein KME29_21935 [Calothrix sp. FI2-JRJ7]|jgi:hydroxyethylthiazole kinase-like sugar kinase family protein|nr:hypothetical protein [Calothrix sp. FI2-JRJ7]